jgi:hypothetical protein
LNNNNTTIALGILCILLIAAMIGGLAFNAGKAQNIPVVEQQQIQSQPQAIQPIQIHEEYHNRSEFWLGYNDGWARLPIRLNCPEYLHGHQIGLTDRQLNCRNYYNRYYPPGFHIRVPGLQINIR